MRQPATITLLAAALAALAIPVRAADPNAVADEVLAEAGVAGGLCVHVGCGDGTLTTALSGGGRFLVHGLGADADAVATAQQHIRSRGIYGQVWAEHRADPELPYAENLVNLLVVCGAAAATVPPAEIARVLVPNGVAMLDAGKPADADALLRRVADAGLPGAEVVRRAGTWVRWRKPRPAGMGEWGHPRHGPSGNAVSTESLAGPPRRVRWVAGPMHEASNLVTAGGRLFHAGILARDAFNGLRLWHRAIEPTPLRLGYPARAVEGSVRPVADRDRLYVFTDGKLQALDAATGKTVTVYDAAAAPLHVLCERGVLIAVGNDAVRALDAAGGQLRWTHKATEPTSVVADDGGVFLLEGNPRRGQNRAVVRLDLASGKQQWRWAEYDWAPRVRRLSCANGLLVCEVSTYNNDRPGNAIHVLSAATGKALWNRPYEPGMSHYMQARAVLTAGLVWVLNKNTWEGLDPKTGSTLKQWSAGSGHCFPPVATPRYLIAGEMNLTDIDTGRMDANRITKGACGRDAGFIPANGLIYCAPKHCACWPMLNGYAALAPAAHGETPAADAQALAEAGPAAGCARPEAPPNGDEWPCYRAEAWRSGSTAAPVPADLDVLWTASLGARPDVRLLADWKDNPYVRGPVTPPVIADGLVVVAQGDGHRIVALDARTGAPRWHVTANGRIDTPPTLHRGLCLFGTRTGWVYALRASDGRLAWRLRVAPHDRRIVSFGQLESPWPVPGSVLVSGGTAYVAAGRHPLADGGVRVVALDPATGKTRWTGRITDLPMKQYYGGAGLEFDAFDLLVAEAAKPTADAGPAPAPGDRPDFITMSRWRIDPATGRAQVAWKSGFGYYRASGGGVMAPRGLWTYGPRMDYIPSGPQPGKPDYVRTRPRPLMVFRGTTLLASSDDRRTLFRKDFSPGEAAAFNDEWFNQRNVPRGNKPGDKDRSARLAHGARWTLDVFGGKQGGIAALVLAGKTAFAAGRNGGLCAVDADGGQQLASRDLPSPVWDGMAAAYGALYVSTADGRVICLGRK